ncbi:MAG: hypothetical protein ABI707_14020 [Ferruginibacter sp.]
MKTILFILVFTSFAFYSRAQSDNDHHRGALAVSVGAAATYYYGQGNHNFSKFENDRVNWQINGMLGLTIGRDKADRRTIIGAFGSFGLNNANTISNIFADQEYITLATSQSSNNNAYTLEGGLLIAEIFRVSTGVGQQIFDNQSIASKNGINFDATTLKFNSTTVGFNFNVGAVGIVLNCNFNYGKDYVNTIINPSAGLNFRF